MTPQQFISEIAPAAVSFYRAHSISAALTIAQAALESGWGVNAPGNNLFGIKATSDWTGPTVAVPTKEFINGKEVTVQAKFRAYPSIGASLEDHAQVLLQPRYKNLIGADYVTACNEIAKVDGYATDPTYGAQLLDIIKDYGLTKYDEEAKAVTYPKVQAQVDGKDVLAVAVDNRTYLNWTVARDSGCNITKIAVGDVEINGNKPPQVSDDVTTYLEWASIPTVDPNPLKDSNGVWQFSTKHAYTWTVTETPSAVVGEWATLEIQTLDNGQPLGKQIITISENNQRVVNDYTDDTGKYVYRITETSGKTDAMTVTWEDPTGKSHSTSHSTVFTAPQATPTPIPPDMRIVAQFPMLPTSDAMNAVYFDMLAPNSQTIQCQLDTGAFELMFTSAAAAILALQQGASITIGGVGGTASAYESTATFSVGGAEFKNVPCVVEPSFSGFPLFGYKFFIDNNYDLLVSHIHHTVTVLQKAA